MALNLESFFQNKNEIQNLTFNKPKDMNTFKCEQEMLHILTTALRQIAHAFAIAIKNS